MSKNKAYLILDNIRSCQNVGAIFRTADAVGVEKIYLVGITPTPIDRFGRVQNKIRKASLGAEKVVEWEKVKGADTLISSLKEEGVRIIAIEQDKSAIDYKEAAIDGDTAFVFGAEVGGVNQETLSLCDEVIDIPMSGKKESLNVSVSVGVILYRLLDT